MSISYKGYTGHAEFDGLDRIFHGRVEGITDIITFEGTSVEELEADFRAGVDSYLEACAERGVEAQRPYSGRFVLRLSPGDHRAAAIAARRAHCSMNEWVTNAIQMRLRAERPASASEADDRVSHAAGG